MGIKRYILLSIVFILAIGLYVYSFEGASFTLDLFGIPIALPIAVWIIAPVVLLMIASTVHMMYYSMKHFMAQRALKKDYETFVQIARAALLGEEHKASFKTEWFKLPGQVLGAMSFRPDASTEGIESEALTEVCTVLSKINAGEYVDLKKYKLRNDSPLLIANRLNQLKTNPKAAPEVLKSCSLLESDLCKKAFDTLLSNASYTEIKRYNFELSPAMVLAILERYVNEEDDLFMNEEELTSLIGSVKMSREEYISASKILKAKLNPDMLIALFEKLYNTDNDAADAYLFVLFELQMIDKAREILDNSDADEFEKFKILLFLRDSGKNSDIELFL